jgi:hypothetical protein
MDQSATRLQEVGLGESTDCREIHLPLVYKWFS